MFRFKELDFRQIENINIFNTLKELTISYNPTKDQLDEIEFWLKAESFTSTDGLFHDLDYIKRAFDDNRIIILSVNHQTAGFVTWRCSDLTATIELMEIRPEGRKTGLGRFLISQLLNALAENNILAVELQYISEESEAFWKRIGFVDFPFSQNPSSSFNDYVKNKLYKIIAIHQQPLKDNNSINRFEIWDDDEHRATLNTATWSWNLNFKENSNDLLIPIIHPCHYNWRVRLTLDGKEIKNGKLKEFGKYNIEYNRFLVITKIEV